MASGYLEWRQRSDVTLQRSRAPDVYRKIWLFLGSAYSHRLTLKDRCNHSELQEILSVSRGHDSGPGANPNH